MGRENAVRAQSSTGILNAASILNKVINTSPLMYCRYRSEYSSNVPVKSFGRTLQVTGNNGIVTKNYFSTSIKLLFNRHANILSIGLHSRY